VLPFCEYAHGPGSIVSDGGVSTDSMDATKEESAMTPWLGKQSLDIRRRPT